MNTVYEGKICFLCIQLSVTGASFFIFFLFICVFKYCVGCCTRLLLLHSSLVVNGTKMAGGWGWAGLSEEDMMEGGGGGGCHGDEGRAC